MKILHIIDSGGLYGAEVMLLNLIAEQVKLGLDPTIASIGEKNIREKPLEAEALKRGFKIKKFRMRLGPNIMGARKILQFAHQDAFDLMHSHGYKGNILFGLMPKAVRKLPLISTLHGWTSTNGMTKMRIYECLDAISLKFIDAVVLVNKAMQSNPKLRNRRGLNLYVVNNGIPIPDVVAQPTQETQQKLDRRIMDFCSEGYTVGAIGRLSKEKGFNFLIQSLHLLAQEASDAQLVIIGEGEERNSLDALVKKLKLEDKVLMPGYKEQAKRYMPFFDVFVIPSLTEGLPITLLEAMHTKVPIVATEVGGIPEALQYGRAGLLVQPSKPHAIAEAINRIYHDVKFAKRLVSYSHNKALTKYTSIKMAQRYFYIYNKLLETHPAKRFRNSST